MSLLFPRFKYPLEPLIRLAGAESVPSPHKSALPAAVWAYRARTPLRTAWTIEACSLGIPVNALGWILAAQTRRGRLRVHVFACRAEIRRTWDEMETLPRRVEEDAPWLSWHRSMCS